jgi:hypothetical protein
MMSEWEDVARLKLIIAEFTIAEIEHGADIARRAMIERMPKGVTRHPLRVSPQTGKWRRDSCGPIGGTEYLSVRQVIGRPAREYAYPSGSERLSGIKLA